MVYIPGREPKSSWAETIDAGKLEENDGYDEGEPYIKASWLHGVGLMSVVVSR